MSLTQRTYFFVTLIVLIGIVDQWTTTPLWMLWMVPAGILALALLSEFVCWKLRDKLTLSGQFTADCASRCELAESTPLELKYTNGTQAQQTIEAEIQWHESLTGDHRRLSFETDPGQSRTEQVTFTPIELGTLSPAKIFVRCLGIFRLAWWPGSFTPEIKLDVVPTRLGKTGSALATDNNGARVSRLPLGSGHDVREIRDYLPGDPMRNVDWKASARSGSLKIRTFDPDERLDIVLVVDTGRSSSLRIGDLDRIGHAANLCARFAELAENRGENIALLTYADKAGAMVPLGRGQRHLSMVRSALGAIQSDPVESNPRTAVATLTKIVSRRALIIFLTQIDEFDAAGELLSAARLLIRKHHVVVASLVDEEVSELISRPPQSWVGPYEQLAGLEYQTALRHTRLELERYGVSIVDTTPSNIEKELFSRYNNLKRRRAVG